jgi:hypothetical protein
LNRRPLPRAREKPRTKRPERVAHTRIKEKASRGPNAEEKRYWDSLPKRCVACPERATVVIHHIMADIAGKRARRDHRFVVVLCPTCHNMGTNSVHLLGSEEEFQRVRGTDLVTIAIIGWEKFGGAG